jgi:enoyl-CoA hydratase/carnithine racemase
MIMALIYRNLGRKKTNELLLLGDQIDALEAERIGLVNRVVPAAELTLHAQVFARELLAADRDALIETKALIQGAGQRDYDSQRAAERAAQVRRIRALAKL